jgi:hypothetical protein
MKAPTRPQRRKARNKPAGPSVLSIQLNDAGNPRWLTADLVDVIDDGCGLALSTRLKSGSTVVVRGKVAEDRAKDQLKAAVRWCMIRPDGTYRAGLEFLNRYSTFQPDKEQTHSTDPGAQDCYEVMQLSPNADAETISRVYRMLAFRYHPDNTETGNSEKFIRLSEAYRILGDPEKRARYDARRRATSLRSKIVFTEAAPSTRSEEVGRKRYDGVKAEVKVSHRGGGKRDHFSPFVGVLRGWNTARRHPSL